MVTLGCRQAEESVVMRSEEKIKEKGTSSTKSCNHVTKSNGAVSEEVQVQHMHILIHLHLLNLCIYAVSCFPTRADFCAASP